MRLAVVVLRRLSYAALTIGVVMWFATPVSAQPVPLPEADQRNFTVGDIRVEGLQRVSEGTVYNYLPVNIGDVLTPARVREAVSEFDRAGHAARPRQFVIALVAIDLEHAVDLYWKATRWQDAVEPYHDRVRAAVLANIDDAVRAASHRARPKIGDGLQRPRRCVSGQGRPRRPDPRPVNPRPIRPIDRTGDVPSPPG